MNDLDAQIAAVLALDERARLANEPALLSPLQHWPHHSNLRDAAPLMASIIRQLAADARRLDWLEEQHTLHKSVEFLYVVVGYDLTMLYDGNERAKFHGETLRAAIDAAITSAEEK